MGITIKPLGLTAPIGRVAYAGGYGRAVRETAAAIREESRFRRQLEEQKRRAEAGIESAERRTMATEAGRMIRDEFGRKARKGEVEAITERAYGLQEARQRMEADREQEKASEESIEALFSELAKSADPIVQRKVKQLRAGYVAGRIDPRFQRPQYAQQIRVQTADQLLKLSAMAPRVSPQQAALEAMRLDMATLGNLIGQEEADRLGMGDALVVRSGTRNNVVFPQKEKPPPPPKEDPIEAEVRSVVGKAAATGTTDAEGNWQAVPTKRLQAIARGVRQALSGVGAVAGVAAPRRPGELEDARSTAETLVTLIREADARGDAAAAARWRQTAKELLKAYPDAR